MSTLGEKLVSFLTSAKKIESVLGEKTTNNAYSDSYGKLLFPDGGEGSSSIYLRYEGVTPSVRIKLYSDDLDDQILQMIKATDDTLTESESTTLNSFIENSSLAINGLSFAGPLIRVVVRSALSTYLIPMVDAESDEDVVAE